MNVRYIITSTLTEIQIEASVDGVSILYCAPLMSDSLKNQMSAALCKLFDKLVEVL